MKGLYLRIGNWGEFSLNHAMGTREVGVSVYDLAEGKPVISEDATDSEFAAQDLAERIASDAPKYLVKGDYVGVGHDGEPLLRNLVKVAEIEICEECGGLAVKNVEDLHIRHVGQLLYPVFRYPVPSMEHARVALAAISSMDRKEAVSVKPELAPFASEVMAAYDSHRENHHNKYEVVLDIGQKLERKVGEVFHEWQHRHSHDNIEIEELETLELPARSDAHALDAMLMS